jgi:hypothetical protein
MAKTVGFTPLTTVEQSQWCDDVGNCMPTVTHKLVIPKPLTAPLRRPARLPIQKPKKRDTKIQQLAYDAAFWLSQHWPEDVAKQGYGPFMATRIKEIISSTYPERYWLLCTLADNQTRIGYPECQPADHQPLDKYWTSGSANSWCTYNQTEPSYGNASYGGHTNNEEFFIDDYLKQTNYKFALPAPHNPTTERPAFTTHKTDFIVNYAHANRHPWGNLYKAHYSTQFNGFSLETASLDPIARMYKFRRKPRKHEAETTEATMHREYTVDARYKSFIDAYDDSQDAYSMIMTAPPAARGTYHFGCLSTYSERIEEINFFLAKLQDDEPVTPTADGFVFLQSVSFNTLLRQQPGQPFDQSGWYDIYHQARAKEDYHLFPQLKFQWDNQFPNSPLPILPSLIKRGWVQLNPLHTYGLWRFNLTSTADFIHGWPEEVIDKIFVPPVSERGNISVSTYVQNTKNINLAQSAESPGYSLVKGTGAWRPRNTAADLPPDGCYRLVTFDYNNIRVTSTDPSLATVQRLFPGAGFLALPTLHCTPRWDPLPLNNTMAKNRQYQSDTTNAPAHSTTPPDPQHGDKIDHRPLPGSTPTHPLTIAHRGTTHDFHIQHSKPHRSPWWTKNPFVPPTGTRILQILAPHQRFTLTYNAITGLWEITDENGTPIDIQWI